MRPRVGAAGWLLWPLLGLGFFAAGMVLVFGAVAAWAARRAKVAIRRAGFLRWQPPGAPLVRLGQGREQ